MYFSMVTLSAVIINCGCLFMYQVTSETDVQNAITVAMETYGGLTAAVNCAGIGIAKRTITKKGPHPLNEFEHILRVNVVGSFNVIRLVATVMAERDPYSESGERGNYGNNLKYKSTKLLFYYVCIHFAILASSECQQILYVNIAFAYK